MFVDFLDQPLEIGDNVVISDANGYSGLNWATIVKFTPKMVRVKYSSSYNKNGEKIVYPSECLKLSDTQNNALMAKILKDG